MGYAHIFVTPSTNLPFWRTDERFPEAAGQKVWTDCCMCKVPAEETDSRIKIYHDIPLLADVGGETTYLGKFKPYSLDMWSGAYFGRELETVCADGYGCTVNPRKKCGAKLRSYWRYGP